MRGQSSFSRKSLQINVTKHFIDQLDLQTISLFKNKNNKSFDKYT